MSTPKYILTADDYGPIDFVNEGVLHHVTQGNINSVRVLSNFEQNLLNENIDKLWKAVPDGKSVDVGIHLTLVSGSPLIKKRDGLGIEDIWDDFVDRKKFLNRSGRKVKDYIFTKYKDFYLEYELLPTAKRNRIEATIVEELAAQKAQLEKALSYAAGQNPDKPNALELNCVSNHFDFFTLSDRFFDLYRDVAGSELAIRSPRRVPVDNSTGYVTAMGVFGVGTFKQRALAKKNIRLMEKYQYMKPVTLKTTSYIDIALYSSLGGTSELVTSGSVDNRYDKLEDIIERSLEPGVWKDHPNVDRVVEIVFHLGTNAHKKYNYSRKDEQGYPGVNYKYFDNRKIEVRTINAMKPEPMFQNVLDNLISWKDCPDVPFQQG